MARTDSPCRARRAVRGFSLIELMVGITISLIVTLAIFQVLTLSESRKRSTTAVNDINQSGAYSAYVLDRALRSAGSGFSNQYLTLNLRADFEGCPLSVTRGGVAVAPRAAAYPAPFNGMTQTPVLAPVIIDPGTGTASDVITVMSGSQGRSEVGARVIGPSVTGVGVVNTFGFNQGDLVLFAHNANEGPCQVSQVGAVTVQTPPRPVTEAPNQILPLAGTYLNAGSTADLAGNLALGIGNDTTNAPQFKMFGIDGNSNLVVYDLLNIDNTAAPQAVAEGVLEMRAAYGVDTNDTDNVKTVGAWVEPTGVWAPAALRDGSAAASARLRNIVAVHVALIMRTTLIEKEDVQATTNFTIFNDLRPAAGAYAGPTPATEAASRAVNYAGGNTQRYRYRVIETTIPLRNNLSL